MLSLRRMAAAVLLSALVGSQLACEPAPEDALWQFHALKVSGEFTPLMGDLDGDGTSDVLWYGRGTLPDAVWFGRAGKRGATSFVRKDLRIDGYYQPQVADLIGDERDEVLWVSSSPSTTLRAWGFDPVSKAPRSHPLEVPLHGRVAVLADRRGPGHKDDLLLLGYGPKRVRFADDGSGATTVIPMSVSGPYQMVIGDWNGDRLDDIVWYAPGTAKDYRWDLYDDGAFRSTPITVNGRYVPVVVTREAADDIFWWASGSEPDAAWAGGGDTFRSLRVRQLGIVGKPYRSFTDVVVIAVPGGRDVLFTISPDDEAEFYNLADPARDKTSEQVPIAGDYDGDRRLDLLWYGAGSRPDELWYFRLPAPDGRPGLGSAVAAQEPAAPHSE